MRSALAAGLFVCHSVCEQDNSRTHLQMSDKHGRHGARGDPLEVVLNFGVDPNPETRLWIHNHFS